MERGDEHGFRDGSHPSVINGGYVRCQPWINREVWENIKIKLAMNLCKHVEACTERVPREITMH